jgi:hypothetical protein
MEINFYESIIMHVDNFLPIENQNGTSRAPVEYPDQSKEEASNEAVAKQCDVRSKNPRLLPSVFSVDFSA